MTALQSPTSQSATKPEDIDGEQSKYYNDIVQVVYNTIHATKITSFFCPLLEHNKLKKLIKQERILRLRRSRHLHIHLRHE